MTIKASRRSTTAVLLRVVQAALLVASVLAADFYKLLGISRDATHKEIKKGACVCVCVCVRARVSLWSLRVLVLWQHSCDFLVSLLQIESLNFFGSSVWHSSLYVFFLDPTVHTSN